MQHYNPILQDNRRLLKLYNSGAVFTAFDTETTGIKAEDCTIIEIGAVKFNKDGELDKFSTLINPKIPIPQIITQITNISDSMVCSMPCIKEVLPGFIEFIGDSILMGHNVQFDLNFLNSECEKNGLPYVRNNALDTLRISRWAYPKAERHKLDYLADALKINKGHSHRAFDDAVTCKELFLRILRDTAPVQRL